jgi:transposase
MTTKDIRFAQPKAPRDHLVLFSQSLDELVTADDPLRAFWALLGEVDWGPWEEAYAGCGQPPIHPRYLASAILYGLLHKVRTTRGLEEACRKHLDFMWLLEGFTPDHSTFANFRRRHAEAIKGLHTHIAEALVARREKALLRLIIDGTRFRADSDRHGAHTAGTIEAIIRELERRMAELETGYFEGVEPEEKLAQLTTEIAQLKKQQAKYQKALDVARERDARAQKHNGKKAKPVRVPVTDPESQVTPNKEGGYAPNYTPVATVESQTGAIVHAGVLPGSDEASAVAPAVEAAAAQRMATPEGQEIYKARAPGIEGVFGCIKAALGIRRFTVRGLSNVRTEWAWICTAYNLKKLPAHKASYACQGPEPGNGLDNSAKCRRFGAILRTLTALCAQQMPQPSPWRFRPWLRQSLKNVGMV